MNGFNWSKALGFGVLIWVALFLLVWATIGLGIFDVVWTQIALAIMAAVVTYLFAVNAKASDLGPTLGYGAVFTAIGIGLDLIFSRQLITGLFGLWTYYLTYALILFAPSVELGLRGSRISADITR